MGSGDSARLLGGDRSAGAFEAIHESFERSDLAWCMTYGVLMLRLHNVKLLA
jgi:hypothetical protein